MFASAGCATHITAARPLLREQETEINDRIEGMPAELAIQGSPQAVVGKNVRLDGSSVRFREPVPFKFWSRVDDDALGPERVVPLASVQRIKIRNHARGMLQGLGIGASIGAGTGLATALALSAAWGSSTATGNYTLLTVGIGVAAGAFIGCMLGTLLGAAIGAPTTIEFSEVSVIPASEQTPKVEP
jgi:hypothetical protein